MYEYNHPFLPPHLYTSLDGKKYIIPTWQLVEPSTTLNDIMWVNKKAPPQIEPNSWIFKSSSGDGEYRVQKVGNVLKCNCMGFFRSKNRKCKHILAVENETKA
jgi:hypothetical protein